jgi:hypothetical protein
VIVCGLVDNASSVPKIQYTNRIQYGGISHIRFSQYTEIFNPIQSANPGVCVRRRRLFIEIELEYDDHISKYPMRVIHLGNRGCENGGQCEMPKMP